MRLIRFRRMGSKKTEAQQTFSSRSVVTNSRSFHLIKQFRFLTRFRVLLFWFLNTIDYKREIQKIRSKLRVDREECNKYLDFLFQPPSFHY